MRVNRFYATATAALVLFCAFLTEAKTPSSRRKTTTGKTSIAAAAKRSAGAKTRAGRRSRATVRARSRGQSTPTPERYAEIQQALADRGYYTGAINGQWGLASIEALKRFQKEQKLEPDGKLGSLSLIALGLGPKREAIGDVAVRPASEPAAIP